MKIAYIAIVALCLTASVSSKSVGDIASADQRSFTHIGTMSGSDERAPRLDLYLSGHAANQADASFECEFYLSGRLLSIFTATQNLEIQSHMNTNNLASTHVWTSGRYDTNTRSYIWSSVNRPFSFKDKWVHECASPNANQGVTVFGTLGAFGWCNNCSVSNIVQKHRFICTL